MPDNMPADQLQVFSKLAESIRDQSAKMGELVGEMRVMNVSHMEVKSVLSEHSKEITQIKVDLAKSNKNDGLAGQVSDIDNRVRAIEITDAENKPTMEATKSVFATVRDWVVAGALGAVAAYYAGQGK